MSGYPCRVCGTGSVGTGRHRCPPCWYVRGEDGAAFAVYAPSAAAAVEIFATRRGFARATPVALEVRQSFRREWRAATVTLTEAGLCLVSVEDREVSLWD